MAAGETAIREDIIMDNNPETIADIVREMRSKIDCLADEPGYNYISCRSAEEWAARIEEAAKRIVITDNSETLRNALARIDELGDALSRVIEERDRLRAALKPVLEINLAGLANYGIDCKSLLAAIVADARNIYKEGETK